jgi:hypothetical protein
MRGAPSVPWWVLVAVIAAGCAAPSGAAAPGRPSCPSIETFAAQLIDVGITYDYEPSRSPAELAERVDMVVRGELTGDVIDQPRASDADDAHVGYEIVVGEILAGEVADGSGTVVVSVPYNSFHTDARAFANAARPGVPVVVFASATPHVPGGLTTAAMEGFATGCEGAAPVGWVGQSGEWSAMTSLDDVATAVTTGTE